MNNSEEKDFIKFLGTAGARYVVAKQLRASAGVFLKINKKRIILDPGPGTLVKCCLSKPPIDISTIDAIILSHSHIDHSADLNILIDGMTEGGLHKRGVIFAPKGAIEGKDSVLFNYLREFPKKIEILEENKRYTLEGLEFYTSIKHKHPVETYGIKFRKDDKIISFMVDTKYFPELIESYKDSYILVINVIRYKPHKSEEVLHLCIDDVKKILLSISPKKVILTHFGMSMLAAKPYVVANQLTKELKIDIMSASDGTVIYI